MLEQHYIDVFRSLIGAEVLRVDYLLYSLDDVQADVLAVKIRFSQDREIAIGCDSDGESLKVDFEIPKDADLGEYGHIHLTDSADYDPANLFGFVNNQVQQISLEIGNRLKAVRIQCGNKIALFSNVGDTLNFQETQFRKMLLDEGWKPLRTIILANSEK